MENKKIKVLQVVGSMNNGGVESFVLSYYKELHNICQFDFLCFDDSKYIPKELIESLGGRVLVVPHVKHLHKFNKALDKILKENEYDIIHSNLNTLSVFPLRIAKKNKCKVRIAHSHSSSNKKELKRHIAKSILKMFSKTYSNVYLSCSESAGRFQFGDKAYDKGEVIIINNAIDVNRFRFNEEYRKEIRNEYHISDNQYVVGTIGRFVGTKNHQYLLDLAKLNKDLVFMIVGNGPLEEDMKRFVSENKLDNVRIIVPDKEVEKYYSAFDVFTLPSLYEGLGLTAIEAESNGLYVICSEFVPSITLITGYGEYLPIDEDSKSKWSISLNQRRERKDYTNKIIEAGYDIKSSSIVLYNLYNKLIEKHSK